MWLSAASLALALTAPGHPLQQLEPVFPVAQVQFRQKAELDAPEYRRILPCLANLSYQGQSVGTAVLIDRTGLYLASRDSVKSHEVEANFNTGQVGHLSIVSEDPWTQLVLLRSDYMPPDAYPVSAATGTPPGTPLLIIVRGGAVSARVISDSRVGVVKPSNRVVPLNELGLELPEASLGNAPVFTADGQFVGLLSASLVTANSSQQLSASPFDNHSRGGFGAGGGGGFGGGAGRAKSSALANAFGPASMTVAYLPSIEVMRLVIEGFSSPDHVVEHPTLGVFCTDGPGGALVREVVADSPASRIGIKDGDMIIGIGSYLVRNKSDFSRSMFKYRSGSRIAVRYDRDGRTIIRETTLGKSPD